MMKGGPCGEKLSVKSRSVVAGFAYRGEDFASTEIGWNAEMRHNSPAKICEFLVDSLQSHC
jgi:hypothetical protein